MTTSSSVTTRLPDGAPAFVAEAERLTNAHDAVGAARVYAADASLELVTDGAVAWHHGRTPSSARGGWCSTPAGAGGCR